MSVRRLAFDQPEHFSLSKAAEREISMWVEKYPPERQHSAILPALWIVQKEAGGWLPEAALRLIGERLDMAYIRVYEVASFYSMFNLAPVGRHHVQICGTTPCWLRGSDGLKAVLQDRIGDPNTICENGMFSWVEVECLGACANAPMVQISNIAGDNYYEDLSPESLGDILDSLESGQKPQTGPQNDRHGSEPQGGALSLHTDGFYDRTVRISALPKALKKVKIMCHGGVKNRRKKR